LRDDVAFVTWADWRTPNRSGFVSGVRFYNYDFGGYLAPISNAGPNTFQDGSTVPVKFQLSVQGQNVSWAAATLWVDGQPAVSQVPGQGNAFRYDPTTQQYEFNLSTKDMNLSPGSHTLIVKLDDGTSHSVTITLR
jgi:hypothetical protein